MPKSDKLDLFKIHKKEYAARAKPALVTVAAANYLTIKGLGKPGGTEFQAKVGALYAAAYTLKFTSKAAGRDFVVCKLEATWWSDQGDLADCPQDSWQWALMIRMPDFMRGADLQTAAEKVIAKGSCPEIDQVHLKSLCEGLCVQALHLGPYDQESETVEAMRSVAAQNGLQFRGRHHEIYLSDPRRVEPDRLKTILRQPVG